MAKKVLPILYFNLGGEMFYVIQQRLEAQEIPKDKADKVIQDIVGAMFRDTLMEEVFKPQNMYTQEAMEAVFKKLVHASIMRLNSTSLNKLCDLMFMVFKFQAVNCIYPEDIFLVTLNHLDAIKDCPSLTPDLRRKVEVVIASLISKYKVLIHLEWDRIYEIIIDFLKDYNTKISVLMKYGLQKPNGELIEPDQVKKQEIIKAVLDKNAHVEILGESVKKRWLELLPRSWCEVNGDRALELGKNIRANEIWRTYPMDLISKKRMNLQAC